jgi:hypothetical protein
MEFAIQVLSFLLLIPLLVLVIATFLRGGYRRFPLVFAYLVADFLTTAAEMPAYISYYANKSKATYALLEKVYWLDEIIMQVLVFTAVISLVYQASNALASRRPVRILLIAGAALFPAISFAIHYQSSGFLTKWMTPWSRDLNLCAMILDLALWTLLLGVRKKDQIVLIISGSLGVKFAGDAISGTLRNLATHFPHHSLPADSMIYGGDIIGQLSSAAFLVLLWQTFRQEARAAKAIEPPQARRLPMDS